MPWIDALRQRARQLKREIHALYLAAQHPLTPWYAKLLVAAIVAYALSPIDLIPDFIPVLGYLDDLLLLPLGTAWAIRMIPAAVMAECRARAAQDGGLEGGAAGRAAAAVIVAVWIGLAVLCALLAYRCITADPVEPTRPIVAMPATAGKQAGKRPGYGFLLPGPGLTPDRPRPVRSARSASAGAPNR